MSHTGRIFEPSSDDFRPYGGTSGHSGSKTSEDRAAAQDADGSINKRDRRTLDLVKLEGSHGMTWRELSGNTGMHHGEASGSLSRLHLGDHLVRLTIRRERCQVYVRPEFVYGRATSEYRPNVTKRVLLDLLDDLAADLVLGHTDAARAKIRAARKTFGGLHE
jgi:hypothetical protein